MREASLMRSLNYGSLKDYVHSSRNNIVVGHILRFDETHDV